MRVLITGGATGLGQAIALKWAEKWAGKGAGLDICIADINQERGDETVNMLAAHGANAFLFVVTQPIDNCRDALVLAQTESRSVVEPKIVSKHFE